jgi:hypothetical protein
MTGSSCGSRFSTWNACPTRRDYPGCVQRLFVLFASLAVITFGQKFSLGVRAGVPTTSLLSTSTGYDAKTYFYTVGPAVQVRWTRRFSVGVDLLYKRLQESQASQYATIHRLELPVLLEYRWGSRSIEPYVGAGLSFNRIVSIQGPRIAEMRHRGTMGFVGVVGFEKRWGRLCLQPELRFTHWVDRNLGVYDAPLRSDLNQLEVLAGIVF